VISLSLYTDSTNLWDMFSICPHHGSELFRWSYSQSSHAWVIL